MWNLLFGSNQHENEEVIDCFYNESFKKESEWLTKKRQEIIEKDRLGENRMLVNNPNREVCLRKMTVLV